MALPETGAQREQEPPLPRDAADDGELVPSQASTFATASEPSGDIALPAPSAEDPQPSHPEVLREAELRRTRDGGACLEGGLQPPPQHEERAGTLPAPEPAVAAHPAAEAEPAPAPALPPVIDVHDLDWAAIRAAVDPAAVRARMRGIVEATETLLDRADGPGMLFDADRLDRSDQAILVSPGRAAGPLWILGDLHGDLLALEAALALAHRTAEREGTEAPRLLFLGDLFDDEGFGLEVLLRVFEIVLDAPDRVCLLAGNHDEALSFDGVRFSANVSPSDFADLLNANLAHEWIGRAGKLAVRLFAEAPRALFFPDGLLVSHGGFPLADLHGRLAETGNWNDPACLSDFVWTRAHPSARKKLPNRHSRGSQFGREDFAAFCALATRLGRPVNRLARGHDHLEDRFAVYAVDPAHPVLTTVALSRRLPREAFGPFERIPTVARVVPDALPQLHRLHIPPAIVREVYPEPAPEACEAAPPASPAEAVA